MGRFNKGGAKEKVNKYRNKKVQVDMYVFDSIRESQRYKELKLLERAGEISNLELQPHFLLQESFKKNGKTYRKIEYIADFKYIENGQVIVEDVKGKETEVFKLKRKLFKLKTILQKKYIGLTEELMR